MSAEGYTETSGAVARRAGVSPPTVRLYADAGRLEYVTASNGTRLFRPDAAEEVKKILAERLANRGGHRRTA